MVNGPYLVGAAVIASACFPRPITNRPTTTRRDQMPCVSRFRLVDTLHSRQSVSNSTGHGTLEYRERLARLTAVTSLSGLPRPRHSALAFSPASLHALACGPLYNKTTHRRGLRARGPAFDDRSCAPPPFRHHAAAPPTTDTHILTRRARLARPSL